MLDVASLQQFDFFSNFTLYAGQNGLYHVISNVVILDYEGIDEDFSDFHEGDFVITNLLYAKDNPEKIYSSFSKLMDKGVSAIAIKTIFFTSLPNIVMELAERKNVPIYFFHSIYIEDVILNITDYLRSSANYNYYENIIDKILRKSENASALNELLQDLISESHVYISSLYVSYINPIDDISIQRNINKLKLAKSSLNYSDNLFFTKYKKGLLFLYFYENMTANNVINQNWDTLFTDLSINKSKFHTGMSDRLLPIKKTDITIQRAIYANSVSVSHNLNIQKYSSLKLNNFILPLSENSYVREYLFEVLDLISDHESASGDYLYKTLIAYVSSNFIIDKTALLLFQHPNTIRYRINKLKSIIHIDNDFDFQVIAMLVVKIIKSQAC